MSTDGENKVYVEVPAHEFEEPKAITTRRILIWVVAIAVVALVSGRLLYHRGYDAKTVPQSLVGEWTSDHPEYSDRYLAFTANSVVFGIGGTSSVKYTVVGLMKVDTEDTDTIVLHFRDIAGTKFQKTMVVDASGDRLHFASQPAIIWQRYGS